MDIPFQKDKSFSELTTLCTGGPIENFFEAEREEELENAVKYAIESPQPFLIIGGGSNLLVSDEGYKGLVIKNSVSTISYKGGILSVKTGTKLQELVDFTIENGLSGFQKMTGIPGTVGGAVYGNAGAYGQNISDLLSDVTFFDGKEVKTLTKAACQFGYRDSGFKKDKQQIVIEVHFKGFISENPKHLKKEADETLSKRLIKYPPGLKTPGSFFKNLVASTLPKDKLAKIPKDKIMFGKIPSGYLLEEVGAKGDQFGQIRISPNHGNTFMNLGEGKAIEFYTLAIKYYRKVKDKFGIDLEPEVQFINLPPLN